MRMLLVAVTLAFGVMRSAVAGSFEDYEDGLTYSILTAETLQWMRPLADQGNSSEQNTLGIMYEKGRGVPQNYVQAAQWYRKSADQGSFIAQFNLGRMYAKGQGVPQDYAQAMECFRLAADRGHGLARGNLGVIYEIGLGVVQDYVQAHVWFNLDTSKNCLVGGVLIDLPSSAV